MTRALRHCLVPLLLWALCLTAIAEVSPLARGIHDYVLPNGLRLVVAVRPELQLAAVNLTVNLGSIDDPPGQSGMAHLLEHVTLSGSTTVGSLNPQAEAAALAELDRAYAAMEAERRNPESEPGALVGLERWFEQSLDAAKRTAESGEILGGRLEARGGVGLNATTTADATQFFGSLPASEIEFWLSLEAERLRHPILRRFYSERNVVLREVATLTGGRPTMQERLLQEIFPGAPVAQSVPGDPDQIRGIDRPTAFAYFHRHYRPENMAIAVVGNVDPEQVHRLCLHYLGDWQPEGPGDPPRSRQEPAPGRGVPVVRKFNSIRSPVVFLALPQLPTDNDKAVALDAVAEIINSEDLSPLKRRLVDEQGIAWNVGASANYPSQKQTAIFLVHVYGNSGIAHETLTQESCALLRSLNSAPEADVRGVILAAGMRSAAQLDDPPTLASTLAFYEAVQGDWSVPFQRLEQLRRLKPEDVRAMARQLFDGLTPMSASIVGK